MKKKRSEANKRQQFLRERVRTNKKSLLIFIVIFCMAGSAFLVLSKAATPTASLEPEHGSVVGTATVGTDGTASGGAYVKFGSDTCSQGKVMNFVAHEDDDILFMNPDLIHNLTTTNPCMTTVYLTTGDDNLGTAYALSREAGARAAYAQMLGKANTWAQSDFSLTDSAGANHTLASYILAANQNIRLVFMRLPDGNVDGSGFSGTAFQSLMKLWNGTITTIKSSDNGTYTDATLWDILTKLMVRFQPNHINIQDYVGAFGDGDHADHHAAAYYAKQSAQDYQTPHTVTGYQGYPVTSRPVNLSGADLNAKYNAWFAYTPYDNQVCQDMTACSADPNTSAWLVRQYSVGSL